MPQFGGVAGQEVEGASSDSGGWRKEEGTVYREKPGYHPLGPQVNFAKGDPANERTLFSTRRK